MINKENSLDHRAFIKWTINNKINYIVQKEIQDALNWYVLKPALSDVYSYANATVTLSASKMTLLCIHRKKNKQEDK